MLHNISGEQKLKKKKSDVTHGICANIYRQKSVEIQHTAHDA